VNHEGRTKDSANFARKLAAKLTTNSTGFFYKKKNSTVLKHLTNGFS
jgi:hypothetical protein